MSKRRKILMNCIVVVALAEAAAVIFAMLNRELIYTAPILLLLLLLIILLMVARKTQTEQDVPARPLNKKIVWIVFAVCVASGALFSIVPRLMGQTGNSKVVNSEIGASWEQPFSENELQGIRAFGTSEESEYWVQCDLISISIKIPNTWKAIPVADADLPSSIFFHSEYEAVTFTPNCIPKCSFLFSKKLRKNPNPSGLWRNAESAENTALPSSL